MKNKNLIVFGFLLSGLILANNAYSQCKTEDPNKKRPFFEVEYQCAKEHSESSYLSDGRDYRALLSGPEVTDFIITFFAGNKYRIAACTDVGGPLSFTVADHRGNTLFSNKQYENAPYWDLEFPVTIECKVSVQLPPETIEMVGGSAKLEELPAVEGDTTKAEEAPAAEKVADVCAVLVVGYKQ